MLIKWAIVTELRGLIFLWHVYFSILILCEKPKNGAVVRDICVVTRALIVSLFRSRNQLMLDLIARESRQKERDKLWMTSRGIPGLIKVSSPSM